MKAAYEHNLEPEVAERWLLLLDLYRQPRQHPTRNEGDSPMTDHSDRLAQGAEQQREQRERKVAAAQALRDLVNDPQVPTDSSIVRAAQKWHEERRLDGTRMTLRERATLRNQAGATNNNDDITHASTSIEEN